MVAGAPAFPLVGAGLGAAIGVTAQLLGRVEPAIIAATVAVGVEAILTGALHMDGLADSADSLGGRSRDRALAIMRDHTLGTYGVVALALNLLLKTAAIAALEPGPVAATVAALSLSRATALPLAAALPYARAQESGTGRLLTERLQWPGALAAVLIASAVAVVALGGEGPVLVGTAAGVALLGAVACHRRLGGVTGDTLGAVVEVSATACLLVAAGFAR